MLKLNNLSTGIYNTLLGVIYFLVVIHLIIYATVWRYDINGNNMDDKTSHLMVSEMSVYDYTNYKWLSENLDNIINKCTNNNCKTRVMERASLSYNYIIPSRLIKYFKILGSYLYNSEIIGISFGVFWGYLSLHFMAYITLACLIFIKPHRNAWWIIFGLTILLVTDELLFNINLNNLSYIVPEKVDGAGYHPTIYVARGPLAIFFFGLYQLVEAMML